MYIVIIFFIAIKLSIIRDGLLCRNESKSIPNPVKDGEIVPTEDPVGCVVAEPYAGNLTLRCVSDLPLPPDVTLVWLVFLIRVSWDKGDKGLPIWFGWSPHVQRKVRTDLWHVFLKIYTCKELLNLKPVTKMSRV